MQLAVPCYPPHTDSAVLPIFTFTATSITQQQEPFQRWSNVKFNWLSSHSDRSPDSQLCFISSLKNSATLGIFTSGILGVTQRLHVPDESVVLQTLVGKLCTFPNATVFRLLDVYTALNQAKRSQHFLTMATLTALRSLNVLASSHKTARIFFLAIQKRSYSFNQILSSCEGHYSSKWQLSL